MSDPNAALQTEEEEYDVVEEDEYEDDDMEVPDEDIDSEELMTDEEGTEEGMEEGSQEEEEAAEAQPQPSASSRGPNPVGQLLQQVNPLKLISFLRQRAKSMKKLVWQAEDLARAGAKFGFSFAIKAARPVIVAMILSRVARTIEASRDPIYRMSRLPEEQQMEYYYSQLLGPDWQEQLQQDMVEAIREVDQGYNTEEINHEKRRLSAVILRRLEVEEWDKERMRHFYYGNYGLGSWYLDMEERLHNPYFIGARAWNGPIENWVGENRVYPDIPQSNVDFKERAADVIEATLGAPVDRQKLRAKEELRPVDRILASSKFAGVVGDKLALKQQVLEAQ